MSEPYSILHISDLHRSSRDPISNDELLSSLLLDRNRYTQEETTIKAPEAIIVSGDLIQGVPLNTANFERVVAEQYEVAFNFLDKLTNHFLKGNRSKVIIVPGNHDVDWNMAFAAMKEIENDKIPKDFHTSLMNENSKYKWDWKTRKAYEIVNPRMYEKRLDAYWDFFKKFYEDVELLNVKAYNQVNYYQLFEGRVAIAAFNSCVGNDCFAYHGMIDKQAIGTSYMELQEKGPFELWMAVWHHNIEGPPYRSDYMNVDRVKEMVGRNFRAGFYGHQHKAQLTPYQIALPDNQQMGVVCAGSLCAGANDLPTGFFRQYNVIELANDLKSMKVHVREMRLANLFGQGRFHEMGTASFAELKWELPLNMLGGENAAARLRLNKIIAEAEEKIRNEDTQSALTELLKIDLKQQPYAKKLALQAAETLEEWVLIADMIIQPQTQEELTIKIKALLKLYRYSDAKDLLAAEKQRLEVADMVSNDILNLINIESRLHHGE